MLKEPRARTSCLDTRNMLVLNGWEKMSWRAFPPACIFRRSKSIDGAEVSKVMDVPLCKLRASKSGHERF